MFGDVGQARTKAAMLLLMIDKTSSRTCTKRIVGCSFLFSPSTCVVFIIFVFCFPFLSANEFKCFWVCAYYNFTFIENIFVVFYILNEMVRCVWWKKYLNLFYFKTFYYVAFVENIVSVNTPTILTKSFKSQRVGFVNNNSVSAIWIAVKIIYFAFVFRIFCRVKPNKRIDVNNCIKWLLKCHVICIDWEGAVIIYFKLAITRTVSCHCKFSFAKLSTFAQIEIIL